MYESQTPIHNGGGVADRKAAADRGQRVPARGRAPDRGRAAPDRERAAPDRERAAPDRERAAPDRERAAPDRERAEAAAGNLDDLWPPFSAPWSDRDAHAQRRLREHAEREQ